MLQEAKLPTLKEKIAKMAEEESTEDTIKVSSKVDTKVEKKLVAKKKK